MEPEPPSSEAAAADYGDALFKELDAYPWDRDNIFQKALAAYLGPNADPSQALDLTLRAQCYYYARKKDLTPIDYDAYRAHVLLQSTSSLSSLPEPSPAAQASSNSSAVVPEAERVVPDTTVSSSAPSGESVQGSKAYNPSDVNPPFPVSFAQVVELITSGAPIPGIRDIPPIVLSGQTTKPLATKRPKPWEKDLVHGGGAFGDRQAEVIAQEIAVEYSIIGEEMRRQVREHVGDG